MDIAYMGQQRCLRKFVVSVLGVENAAMMTDSEIEEFLEKSGYVLLDKDNETSLIVSEGDVCSLVDGGKAAWLKR